MATLEEIKKLIETELSPIRTNLQSIEKKFVDLKTSVDYMSAKCKRLLVGLVEYMQLQDVMAWLSTLGGAYSAMGEHFYSYSEKAGQISQHQLLVAMRLGNPVLAAQCKVFAALSLIQRGRLKMASRIIREQYHLAFINGYAKDEKLISSCKAAWIRIQYIRKQHKAKTSGTLTPKDTSTR